MHKICAPDSAVAPSPDSLTRAATPLRIAEVRQPRALGSRAPEAERRSCAPPLLSIISIGSIGLVIGSGIASWHYPTGPFTEADDDDVCGLARLHAAAARRLPRRAMLYLVADRPEAKADETSIRARPGSRQNQEETPRLARRT